VGRITQVSKVIGGTTYNLGYSYNNANQLTTLTYPSGRQVAQTYDGVGRLSQIVGLSGPYINIASTDYNAAGQVKHLLYGNGVQGDLTYNDHLQLSTLRYSKPGSPDLLNLGYDYGTGNNGQIQAVHYYSAPGVEAPTNSEYFTYDAWLRLKTASTGDLVQPGTWRLQWDYDRFGNRRNQTLTGGSSSAPQPQLNISEVTNRITDAGFAYDAAGNLTNDALHTYTYDGENRIKTVDSTAATYTYDAGPLRIKKLVGSTTTLYIFSGSKVIAEYVNGALSLEYAYAGSQLLATVGPSDSFITYHHPDHLSARVQSDSTGAVVRYNGQFPFGETWYVAGPSADKWFFTSYERDSESQLDYAIFRGYNSRLGRFMSPDLLADTLFRPQSLNGYAYVLNDPVNFVDPLGLQRRRGGGNEQDILLPEMNHTGCTLDRAWITCGLGASITSTGAAVVCHLADCNFVRLNPVTGELQSYTATSTGAWGACANATYSGVGGTRDCLGRMDVGWHFEWQTIPLSNYAPGLFPAGLFAWFPQQDGASQAAKQAARGRPAESPGPTLREVPGEEPVLDPVNPARKAWADFIESIFGGMTGGTEVFFPFVMFDPSSRVPKGCSGDACKI
jgi:RHS repeat-associated protein